MSGGGLCQAPPLLGALHNLFLLLAPAFIYKAANSDVEVIQRYSGAAVQDCAENKSTPYLVYGLILSHVSDLHLTSHTFDINMKYTE